VSSRTRTLKDELGIEGHSRSSLLL